MDSPSGEDDSVTQWVLIVKVMVNPGNDHGDDRITTVIMTVMMTMITPEMMTALMMLTVFIYGDDGVYGDDGDNDGGDDGNNEVVMTMIMRW